MGVHKACKRVGGAGATPPFKPLPLVKEKETSRENEEKSSRKRMVKRKTPRRG
ncbi:Putative hypothetical protein [Helicobacter mustelae 12198]|uniref:Uncharacterized protein n=1 Tax=Helicobacter mustelae (strain ATCC 43772 / CCUG 25715 / CIP 103759 / LMG 18044 / NCTC 12198 / R85-136P) TaxID=679897 RepID=D3UHU7_HELM1|nr:Putative hypothetical protein [Helicobacter mustelae 12198]